VQVSIYEKIDKPIMDKVNIIMVLLLFYPKKVNNYTLALRIYQ